MTRSVSDDESFGGEQAVGVLVGRRCSVHLV